MSVRHLRAPRARGRTAAQARRKGLAGKEVQAERAVLQGLRFSVVTVRCFFFFFFLPGDHLGSRRDLLATVYSPQMRDEASALAGSWFERRRAATSR